MLSIRRLVSFPSSEDHTTSCISILDSYCTGSVWVAGFAPRNFAYWIRTLEGATRPLSRDEPVSAEHPDHPPKAIALRCRLQLWRDRMASTESGIGCRICQVFEGLSFRVG